MICLNNVKDIHLIGVCGTAMGNLAVGLKKCGYRVTGSDSGVYPPMSDFLLKNGIEIREYSINNLKGKDLVIIGNAIPRGNIEVEYVLNNKIPFTSLPEALKHFFIKDKKLIMITGTHGKTTTSSLIAYILEYNNLNPSYLIGGLVPQLKSGFHYSESSRFFVLEGDEYDTAFFDKTSKFLKFIPDYLVINYIEFDHGDIFNSLKDVKRSFIHLLKKCPEKAIVFLNSDNKNTISLKKHCFSRLETFGTKKPSDYLIKYTGYSKGKSHYQIAVKGKTYNVSSYLHGEHNGRNIAAAFAVCTNLGLSPEEIINGISSFKGVERRFQVYYQNKEKRAIVIQDFAHHPTAFKYTIETAGRIYPDKKIIAFIEPGTNTIRSGKFNKRLKPLSHIADILVFLPVPSKKKHSIKDNFHPPEGENIVNLNSVNEIKGFLEKGNFENVVFLFMSNSSPWKYLEAVKEFFESD